MFEKFFKSESASGILLIGITALALLTANSPLAPAYFGALHSYVGGLSLHHWINDGLMALFFLLVGLEIRRELSHGELSTWPRRILPGLAALGGMAAPALVYVWFNRGGEIALHGWAIPTATDIAFSLGVLALFGSRVPLALKVFLTALAIIDDLLAVMVIALFYGSGLAPLWLGTAVLLAATLFGLSRARVMALWPYLLLGLALWFCVLKSGVHATLAGVILAFVMPEQSSPRSPSAMLEHGLHKWVAFGIVPVFAFANAGVSLVGLSLATLFQPVTLGVAAGLFVGKQIGIFGVTWVTVKLGIAQLPRGMSWASLYGVSLLCGIGFTISLFIGALAFSDPALQDAAKLGVLLGSLVSGLAGMAVLKLSLRDR
jgi:NhaA family Na+:H+ antiporter